MRTDSARRSVVAQGLVSAGISACGLLALLSGCAAPDAPGPFSMSATGERVEVAPFAIVAGEQVEVPDVPMGDSATVERILLEGMNRNRVMDHLTHLTQNIGARLTGSTNCEVANEWAASQFRKWGLKNVENWQWGEVAVRFDRGPSTAVGYRQGEAPRELDFSTSAWTIGTNGPVRGSVVAMPSSLEELASVESRLEGAWVVIVPETARQGSTGGGVRRGGVGVRDARRREARERLATDTWPDIGPAPSAAPAPSDPWAGSWQGTTSGMGQTFTLNMTMDKQADGTYTGSMAAPEAGADSHIENPAFEGDRVTFTWASPAEVHTIKLARQADGTLKGETTYLGEPFEIRLARAAAEPTASEPDPGAVQDYILQKVLSKNPAGFVSSSGDIRVWTGGASGWRERKIEDYSPDIEVTITEPDYQWVLESINSGGPSVELAFDLDHRLTAGPIPVYNTIAEIPGVDPDLKHEVVIVSAHLDSWNGPGSEGCVDNGTGSSVVLESARILKAAGARPKRTIRFILWTGEEQGLLGSRAYVDHLGDDLANISAVFVDDGGTNYEGGLHAIEGMRDYLAAATAPVNGRFYSEEDQAWLNVNVRIEGSMPAGGGSDHASFNRAGVPGFFWDEVGRADYRHGWHTQFDRLDQAIPEYLVQSSTCMAVTAYNLACAPEKLARQAPREPREGGEGSERRRPGGGRTTGGE